MNTLRVHRHGTRIIHGWTNTAAKDLHVAKHEASAVVHANLLNYWPSIKACTAIFQREILKYNFVRYALARETHVHSFNRPM